MLCYIYDINNSYPKPKTTLHNVWTIQPGESVCREWLGWGSMTTNTIFTTFIYIGSKGKCFNVTTKYECSHFKEI